MAFTDLFRRRNNKAAESVPGVVPRFDLSKESDRKKLRKIVIELQRATDALTRKDIRDWRAAWQRAINVNYPDRRLLYDIYNDVDVDLHLTGCKTQRTEFVMARSFRIVNQQGEDQDDALHYFDQGWFKEFCRLVLDSIYFGHSLIELGDLTTDGDGHPSYDGVELIPRKHVIPEFHRVILTLGQDWHTGIDYHEAPFNDRLIEAGKKDSLGLYLKAALQTIPKKNVLAFWDSFSEIFGMPMRIARTSSRDQNEIDRLDKMLRTAGASLSMVAGMETEIQFVESSRGDAFNVYDKRVDRANSELSKLVVGQTMTVEDGSSLSQSQTHLTVFENLVEADADMLRDVINNQLLPRMIRHGFPLAGLRFDWDYSLDYTPEQQLAIDTAVADRYDVPGDYFTEKYGIPAGARRQAANPFAPTDDDKKKAKEAHPFFT